MEADGSASVENCGCLIYSLLMTIEFVDGEWWIDAHWLKYPITAASFEQAYWKALEKRHDASQRAR